MSAGNSDFSGVTQAGLGQGFAQGVREGTDNFNRGVDRKTAQANTYLTQFIGPNLAKLSQALPRPKPGATPEELRAWAQAEAARRQQVEVLLSQSDKYLKLTGSPLTRDEWGGLFYDPTTALSPEEWSKITANINSYGALEGQAEGFRQRLKGLDPASEAYKQVLTEYEEFKKNSGYQQVWESVNGVAYQEMVGSDAFRRAVRNDKAVKNDETFLAGVLSTSKKPEVQALANELIKNGIGLDAINPATGQTYRSFFMAQIDTQELTELLSSGKPEGVNAALQRIMSMTDEEKAQLPQAAKDLWSQYQAFQKDPTSVPPGVNKLAFQSYVRMDQEVAQAQNSIVLGGVNIVIAQQTVDSMKKDMALKDIQISDAQRESIWKFGALASEGNFMVTASKGEFMDLLGNMPQDQKDALWKTAVMDKLTEYAERQAQAARETEANLLRMQIGNSSAMDEAIEKGSFHLSSLFTTDSKGNVLINKDGEIYKRLQAVQGNPSDATIMAWHALSKKNYENQDATTRQNLAIGAARVRAEDYNANILAVQAQYAPLMAKLTYEGQVSDVAMKQIEANIAPALAAGRVSVLLGEAVKAHGPAILNDPKFAAPFIATMGETAYNAAKRYAEDEAKFLQMERTDKQRWSAIQKIQTYFSNIGMLRTLAQDPQLLQKLATDAGMDVQATSAMVKKLANEGATLQGLELQTMSFRLTAEQRRLAMEEDHQAWLVATDKRDYEARRIDANRNYGLSVRGVELEERQFTYRQWLDKENLRWDKEKFKQTFGLELEQFKNMTEQQRIQWAWRQKDYVTENAKWGKQFALQYAADYRDAQNSRAEQNIAIAGLKASVLTPLAQQASNVKSMQDEAQMRMNAQYQAGGDMQPYMTEAWSQKFKIVNGAVVGVEGASTALRQSDLDKLTAWNKARKDVVAATNSLKAINGTLSSITTEFMQNYGGASTDPYDLFGDLGNGAGVARGSGGGQGQLPPVSNFSTATQADIVNSLTAVINGQSPRYANWNVEGFCLTLVQNVMNDKIDWKKVTGGPPIVGGELGARNWFQQMKTAGATQVKGGQKLSAAEIAKLPDGTIVFQNTKDVEGHIAIVVGGKIIQNSTYPNDKTINGAVGIMEPTAFVKGGDVTAIQIPDSWWKGGGKSGTTKSTTTSKSSTGGSSSSPASTSSASSPTYNQKALENWVTSNVKPNGVNIVKTLPKNTSIGRMTVPDPKGKGYAVLDDNTAVGYVKLALPSIQVTLQKATGSKEPLAKLIKSNPSLRPQFRDMIITQLRKANVTGDIGRIVDIYFKKQGW